MSCRTGGVWRRDHMCLHGRISCGCMASPAGALACRVGSFSEAGPNKHCLCCRPCTCVPAHATLLQLLYSLPSCSHTHTLAPNCFTYQLHTHLLLHTHMHPVNTHTTPTTPPPPHARSRVPPRCSHSPVGPPAPPVGALQALAGPRHRTLWPAGGACGRSPPTGRALRHGAP